MKDERALIDELSKLLGILIAERESYEYVDKLGYSQSNDLALFHLKEAMRDFHTLKSKGFEKSIIAREAEEIDLDKINESLSYIALIEDRRELRKIVSLITSKALSISAKYLKASLSQSSSEEGKGGE